MPQGCAEDMNSFVDGFYAICQPLYLTQNKEVTAIKIAWSGCFIVQNQARLASAPHI